MEQRKYVRRKNYLINKPLQFAYAGIAIWLLLIGIILVGTFTYYITLDTILRQMESAKFSSDAYQLVRSINYLLSKKIGSLLIFVVILAGVLEILYMHRIAGPIFRIERTLKEVAEGKSFSPIRLRRKDFFKTLAEAVNKFMEFQNKKDTKIKEILKKAENYPELKQEIEEVKKLFVSPQ